MRKNRTREHQYEGSIDMMNNLGPVKLGLSASFIWRNDPQRLCFLLARYKFCAKMLNEKSRVLEVGCGDGFGASIVLQNVGSIHGIDFDPVFIKEARRQNIKNPRLTFSALDITKKPLKKKFDAAYSFDTIEHIPQDKESAFMINICRSLKPQSVFIIGTPNLYAKDYASKESSQGHVNLKDAESLKMLMQRYFHNVFIFSMNDEVVHTGFYPMAHYLIALAVALKRKA